MKSTKLVLKIVFAVALVFAFAGCGGGAGPGEEPIVYETGTGTLSTAWYSGGPGPFTLNSPDDLAGLAQLVNESGYDFEGKTIKLGANFDLVKYSSGKGWVPIGIYTGIDNAAFEGNFDGAGLVYAACALMIPN